MILDLALVAVFAAVGRASHDESLTFSGWWHTAWPFLAGGGVGWAVALLQHRPGSSWTTGLLVVVATVAVGMALRRLTGEGTAVSFVVVATAVLGILLLGSRLLPARWFA